MIIVSGLVVLVAAVVIGLVRVFLAGARCHTRASTGTVRPLAISACDRRIAVGRISEEAEAPS
ncbi:hypothetical protein R3Q06_33835 [Rhodococcus erythropolis]|uniref:hypothetical protein n=1 Tax=Rhodococcus erythropolis TaxID=1833 RepID=UPI002949D4F8|nr:hypothetical protein [Rhodococcus erythropolis]MDV6278408.1 hypothetical protein [Rhodococcus erythropolis]